MRWIEAHGSATFEGEGNKRHAVSLVGTVADITEQKLADDNARTILESITDAFFAIDSNWKVTYINPQGERVLNRQPGDLVGKVIWDEYQAFQGTDLELAYRRAADERISTSLDVFYPDHDRGTKFMYTRHQFPRELVSTFETSPSASRTMKCCAIGLHCSRESATPPAMSFMPRTAKVGCVLPILQRWH